MIAVTDEAEPIVSNPPTEQQAVIEELEAGAIFDDDDELDSMQEMAELEDDDDEDEDDLLDEEDEMELEMAEEEEEVELSLTPDQAELLAGILTGNKDLHGLAREIKTRLNEIDDHYDTEVKKLSYRRVLLRHAKNDKTKPKRMTVSRNAEVDLYRDGAYVHAKIWVPLRMVRPSAEPAAPSAPAEPPATVPAGSPL